MLAFDPRIVGPQVVAFLRACQARIPFHLAGGAALAGLHLRHRLSADADLFVHSRSAHRDLTRALPEIGAEVGLAVRLLRDSGPHVRAVLSGLEPPIEIDVVFDQVADLEPPGEPVEGVVVESFVDLRANKLTCLLLRAEPRDLVDVMFLDRAGSPLSAICPSLSRRTPESIQRCWRGFSRPFRSSRFRRCSSPSTSTSFGDFVTN